MKDNSFEAKVRLTFANNPALKQASFTADGKAFYEEADAMIHTKKLSNKAIVTLTRDQVKGMDFSDSNALQEQLEASVKAAAKKKEVPEDGNEFTDVTGQKPASSQKPEDGSRNSEEKKAEAGKTENKKSEEPAEISAEQLDKLKDEYKELSGSAPGKWKPETIAKKVAELKAKKAEDNKGKEEQ
ncbi:hypothetical protein [Roseivirga sp. UBA838]|uniref:hypothetical protein n=1 Tax=Roseivirga sp. UBA838 TaxID=1947393 RepID=UPI00257B9FEE|nr:hypothetical protein [Roseivirga sp. UBA838]|tara:strand:+ start:20088 stop:20642 length:555 start_codon:yes stop_codon:yes gene_type:complete